MLMQTCVAQTTLGVETSQHAHIVDAIQTQCGDMHYTRDVVFVQSNTDAAIRLDHCVAMSIHV